MESRSLEIRRRPAAGWDEAGANDQVGAQRPGRRIELLALDRARSQELAALVNRAFVIEARFVEGDRIEAAEIARLASQPSAAFLGVFEDQTLVGCVLADARDGNRGYIGLLAVEPARAGQGLGRELMTHAETHLQRRGCRTVFITVLDQRTDLFPIYERRGYRRDGTTLPFRRQTKVPCVLVVFEKDLSL
jgi:GNAT superfamily N-acetyltransferase